MRRRLGEAVHCSRSHGGDNPTRGSPGGGLARAAVRAYRLDHGRSRDLAPRPRRDDRRRGGCSSSSAPRRPSACSPSAPTPRPARWPPRRRSWSTPAPATSAIIAADRTDVRLTTKEKRSIWGGGHVRVSGDAADLRLKDHCDGFPVVDDRCGVDSILEVPRATSVRVVTGTGDLRAENLQGSAELQGGHRRPARRRGQRTAAAAARRPATCTSRGRRPTSSRARARATSTSRPAGRARSTPRPTPATSTSACPT